MRSNLPSLILLLLFNSICTSTSKAVLKFCNQRTKSTSKTQTNPWKWKTAGKSILKNDFNQTVLPFSRVFDPKKKIYKPLSTSRVPPQCTKSRQVRFETCQNVSSRSPYIVIHASKILSSLKNQIHLQMMDCLFDCNSTWCSINLTRITRTEDDARPFIQDKQMRPD